MSFGRGADAAGWSRAESVPLSFDPGEAHQFDRSPEIVVTDGVTITAKVAHVRLCHSRMVFVRAYPRETQEMVFDAHDKALAFFGGACARDPDRQGARRGDHSARVMSMSDVKKRSPCMA
jgi:hypothetical protein